MFKWLWSFAHNDARSPASQAYPELEPREFTTFAEPSLSEPQDQDDAAETVCWTVDVARRDPAHPGGNRAVTLASRSTTDPAEIGQLVSELVAEHRENLLRHGAFIWIGAMREVSL